MSWNMPNPVLINSTYYIRVAVPSALKDAAYGTKVTLPIGDTFATTTVTKHVKASLRTKDIVVARRRFPAAMAAIQNHWESVREGPQELSHRQLLALAGNMRATFVSVFDEEPGGVVVWEKVLRANEKAQEGSWHELMVGTTTTVDEALERRFGGLVDAQLAREGLNITCRCRVKLLGFVAVAMSEAAAVNKQKALGDYSDSGETSKYPPLEKPKRDLNPSGAQLTLSAILDKKVAAKALGKDAAPMRPATEAKFRRLIKEFSCYRGNDIVGTITTQEVHSWSEAMLREGKLSNNTIAQRIQNLRTLVEYGRRQSFGTLFVSGNPIDLVDRPQAVSIPSSERTLRLDEARAILEATRTRSTRAETRWLPWLCAYSGARINEVGQLRIEDVFQSDGRWFMRLSTMGGRTLKNLDSWRNVPIHRDIIEEGFLDFVAASRAEAEGDASKRLFSATSQSKVLDWIRKTLKITRAELQPNHGWRHLFEDWAMRAGMRDAAKLYITGRKRGGSAEGYGRSEAMLAGLAVEMDKLSSFLEVPQVKPQRFHH